MWETSKSRVGGTTPPYCPRKPAETLASPQTTGEIPAIYSRFWRPAGSIPPFAAASASEIINAQQRYLGAQEPRPVRGSTVQHRRPARGRVGATLAQSVAAQLDGRQRRQASPSASAILPTTLPPRSRPARRGDARAMSRHRTGWHEKSNGWPAKSSRVARISKKMAPMKTGVPLIDGLDEKAERDMTMMTTAITVPRWYLAISIISTAAVLTWGRARARKMEQ